MPFSDPIEHLLEELAWIRALVDAALARIGRRPLLLATDEDRLTQFAVTERQAHRLLDPGTETPAPPGEAELIRLRIDARIEASRAAGLALPLDRITRDLELDELSRRVLVLLAGCELDEGIRRLFAYAWDDFTRRAPSAEFLLGLLQPSSAGRLVNAYAFLARSPLVRWDLVHLGPMDGSAPEPFGARSVRLSASVAAAFLGRAELDPELRGAAAVVERAASDDDPDLVLADTVRDRIARNLQLLDEEEAAVIVLVGPAGCGKTTAAMRYLSGPGRPVIAVQVERLMRPYERVERRVAALRRDARLLGAPLLLDLADAEHEDPSLGGGYRALADLLREHRHGAVITARDGAGWFLGMLDQAALVHIPHPSKDERAAIWLRALAEHDVPAVDTDVLEAATRYPLTGGAIRRAAVAAGASARGRGADRRALQVEDVVEACRAQLTPRLSGIAQRIVTTFTWEDLILPRESRRLLREIVAYAKNRARVFDEWGYGRILPYGRGLSVLFSGPPGTGKTMAAGIVAGELGMELFRVDLSRTVSKYIGETEKNLGRIFDEATKSQSILLFDEADSLFARRTDVKSSVDRYANLEVNYLLQRMEDFEGVTILTTNFEGSLDDAFRRRIRYRVNFPAPDEATRAALWRSMIPPQVELEDEIEALELAQDFDLSGGHIKNAAVRAAFFAADRGTGLRMNDLRKAATLECEKLGRVVRAWRDEDLDEEDEDDAERA
jgi:SpoVK/Ycf46/Vps4 family AAA+-type ATPase